MREIPTKGSAGVAHRRKLDQKRARFIEFGSKLAPIQPIVNGGFGPSQLYTDAFERYSLALKDLVQHNAPIHIEEWSWDGYEGNFFFRWKLSAQLCQIGRPEFDRRYVAVALPARFPNVIASTLDAALAEAWAEAEHYADLAVAMMRWARDKAEAAAFHKRMGVEVVTDTERRAKRKEQLRKEIDR